LVAARTPNGKETVLGDITGQVDVWDVTTGRVTRSLRLPADRDRNLTFSPDGRLLLDATQDGNITVREAATGKAVRGLAGSGALSWALTFAPGGRRLLATRHNETRLLTWPDGAVVWQQPDTCLAAFSPDVKRLVSGNWNRKTLFRDPQSGAV